MKNSEDKPRAHPRACGGKTKDTPEVLHYPLDVLDLGAQPEADISGDLIVAAATSVKLASNVGTNELCQAALVGGVDVFVALLDLKRPVLPPIVWTARALA